MSPVFSACGENQMYKTCSNTYLVQCKFLFERGRVFMPDVPVQWEIWKDFISWNSGRGSAQNVLPSTGRHFRAVVIFCTSAEHNLPPNWLSPTTGSPSSDAVCKGEKHGGALNKTSLNSLQECVSLFDVGSLASLGRYIDFMATEVISNFTAFSFKETHAWSEVGYFYSILVKCFLGLRIELFSAAHWLQIVNIFGLLKLGFIIYEMLAFCSSKGAILINSTKLQNFWEAKALTSPHILCKRFRFGV